MKAKELLAHRLLSVHNLTYYQGLMQRLRDAVLTGDSDLLEALKAEASVASRPVRGGA